MDVWPPGRHSLENRHAGTPRLRGPYPFQFRNRCRNLQLSAIPDRLIAGGFSDVDLYGSPSQFLREFPRLEHESQGDGC
jgi:hypothetical protein